jgi:predicted helicase
MNTSGVQSGRDLLFIDENHYDLEARIEKLLQKKYDSNFSKCYNVEDSSGYPLLKRIAESQFNPSKIQKYLYRPFDPKIIYYDEKLIKRAFFKVHNNLIEKKENFALIASRQCIDNWKYVFCTNNVCDMNLIASAGKLGGGNVFPLYLYPTDGEEQLGETRKPNLDEKIWHKIDACLDECHSGGRGPIESMDPIEASPLQGDNRSHITTPEQIFDYIYGVLHTPSYREKYKEFLKIDFPRIPYPENKAEFERIVSIGNKLRKLHLMEEIPPQATSFDIEGDNVVSDIRFEKEIPDQVGEDIGGKVYINKTQYFANVPEQAWNFYIGGYQPAQKWLKDRKNRTLTYDDISHYRKIIAILIETHNLMLKLEEK